MAARAIIPRLTLFSGKNCSLCDVAKAELSNLRARHEFTLNIVDIREPGNERWQNRYQYWIPALHLEGKEIAKGRWSAADVEPALGTWQEENDVIVAADDEAGGARDEK